MPPLPALKSSPGREHMTEKSYKSGQNFGSRLTLKAKDDDLLLFNQVKNQEGDNFLLHTADDFEDSLSKMRHFSGFKLGINIPTRGEAGDLLNVEGDKNDYDWLLTPPDTPLFSKLDEGVSQPIKLAPRGRIRSQPIPISRSVTEKSYRRSQTSYSPQRLNTSPRTSGTLARVGGRSSSSTQSSPPPVIQSTTPTRGSYSPPNKPYTPTHKSSTTTLPRTSTSSSNHAPNCGGRGASPVNETHVNLSFPKSQGWQKTFPGLNSDAPPNMRASSLAPSISHVRGSSPASRNEKELSMKLRRKSMSPTSSRSFGSSHGSEVHISSYCTYSGDFDEESLNSRTLGVSRSPPPRKAGSLANNKDMSFSRMPSKTSPSNSAPKRSFDSALRLMDQRRIPQNMFRPLLSGVPTTTFQPIYSRNSSLTISSSTSSDQGVIIVAEDLEGTEIEQNVLYGVPKRTEDFDTHEEVFLFDKVDNKVKDTSDETLFGNSQAICEDFGEIMRYKSDLDDIQNAIVRTAICSKCCKEFDIDEMIEIKKICNQCAEEDRFFTAEISSTCGSYNENDSSQVDTAVDAVIQDDIQSAIVRTAICSKCCKEFGNDETIGNKTFCNQCAEDDRFITAEIASTCEPYNENDSSQVDTAFDAVIQERKLNCEALKFHEDDEEASLGQHESNSELAAEFSSNSVLMQWLGQNESQPSDHHLVIKMNVKDDVPEVAGISVLLQGSSSTKWPILQGKALSATNILSSVPSHDRHNDNVLRRSIGLDSSSTTSVVQHQLSSKTEAFGVEMDIDNDASFSSCEPRSVRNEFDDNFGSAEYLEYDSSRDMTMVSEEHGDSLDQSNLNSTTTSSSRPVIFEYRSLHADTCRSLGNEIDEIFSSAEYLECESFSDIKVVSEDNTDTLDRSNLNSMPFSRPVISEEYRFVRPDNYRAASSSDGNNDLSCSSTAEISCADDCSSSTYTDEDHQNSGSAVVNMERATDISLSSEMAEHHIMGNYTCENVILETGTNSSSIVTIESQDGYSESEEWKNECAPSHDPPSPELSNEHSVSQTSKNDMHLCSSESGAEVLENGASAIMVEGPRGRLSRNLTLEEATDTILFCSSIIHDLAYNAATIAAENEQEPLAEHLAPLPVTILEKSIPGLRGESAKMSTKPKPKPQKFKRKKVEIQPKAPLKEVVNTNIEGFTAPTDEFPRKLEVAKPPKLESKCSCSVM